MNEVRIISATLKTDRCLNYAYELEVGKGIFDTIKRKSEIIVHDDMVEAFAKLSPHLPFAMDDMIGDRESLSKELFGIHPDTLERFDHYYVSGFEITGKVGEEAVILKGNKVLALGGMTVELPEINLTGSGYRYLEELAAALNLCILEIEAHMDGKCAPVLVQSEMDFETTVVVTDKPKRGRKKKTTGQLMAIIDETENPENEKSDQSDSAGDTGNFE